MASRENPLKGLFRWVANQFVRDVSEDDALCAFDCRSEQCTVGEWETCDRRLNRAAGELMPASEQDPAAQVEPRLQKRASSLSRR